MPGKRNQTCRPVPFRYWHVFVLCPVNNLQCSSEPQEINGPHRVLSGWLHWAECLGCLGMKHPHGELCASNSPCLSSSRKPKLSHPHSPNLRGERKEANSQVLFKPFSSLRVKENISNRILYHVVVTASERKNPMKAYGRCGSYMKLHRESCTSLFT